MYAHDSDSGRYGFGVLPVLQRRGWHEITWNQLTSHGTSQHLAFLLPKHDAVSLCLLDFPTCWKMLDRKLLMAQIHGSGRNRQISPGKCHLNRSIAIHQFAVDSVAFGRWLIWGRLDRQGHVPAALTLRKISMGRQLSECLSPMCIVVPLFELQIQPALRLNHFRVQSCACQARACACCGSANGAMRRCTAALRTSVAVGSHI